MKCKFAIHIQGPDDLIPVHNLDEAVRVSAFMNADYAALLQSVPQTDTFTPYCFAVPAVWPHSDEAHQQELDRLKTRAKESGHPMPYWMAA